MNGEQFDVLTKILELSGPSSWSGALESIFKSPGKTKKKIAKVAAENSRLIEVIDRLEELELIGCWRRCEDTEYYVLTPKGMTEWWLYATQELSPARRRRFI